MVPLGPARILIGRQAINDFESDSSRGAEWYQRAHRAHANCLENLPVYTALVVALAVANSQHPAFDSLALALLAARVAQTTTHVACRPTQAAVAVRFTFFLVQLGCMAAMGCLIAAGAAARA